MRQSQKPNRSRGKSGRKPNGGGGFSPNRVYESSGPEGKVRGTPQQIIEKYQSLARDKATAGDRVMAESFLQHAEHYMRILTAAQAASPQRNRDDSAREETASDERETADADSGADPLAVIGDDGESDIVQTAESAGGGSGGRGRRRDDDGDGEPRRGRGRGRRRERPTRDESDSAPEGESESAATGDGAESAPLSAAS